MKRDILLGKDNKRNEEKRIANRYFAPALGKNNRYGLKPVGR